MSETLRIEGTVAPGFEPVRTLYERNMQKLAERDTQLCVYFQGEKVVDLWASHQPEAFSPDALVNIFSSGKSLEAIAMAWLAGKGLLDYNAKVARYWPEFAANGKDQLTVAELMRHEAGLAAFDESIDPVNLLTDNIKQNAVGQTIERQAQQYREQGSRREYHAVTRGWIVNEVFRRVDPAGRTIGEFLREDVSGPLGVDLMIGVPESELGRRVPVKPLGFGFQFKESLKPRFMGRRMERNVFQTIGRIGRLVPGIRNGTTRGAPAPFVGMDAIAFFNEPAVALGETPSANTHANARSLARLAAVMAEGGRLDNVEVLSADGARALHHDPLIADMGMGTTTFTQGGVAHFRVGQGGSPALDRAFNEGREGFYGWMGLGGSIFQWHPGHRIGFGYVPTSLNVLDLFNERGKGYQAEVVRCIGAL